MTRIRIFLLIIIGAAIALGTIMFLINSEAKNPEYKVQFQKIHEDRVLRFNVDTERAIFIDRNNGEVLQNDKGHLSSHGSLGYQANGPGSRFFVGSESIWSYEMPGIVSRSPLKDPSRSTKITLRHDFLDYFMTGNDLIARIRDDDYGCEYLWMYSSKLRLIEFHGPRSLKPWQHGSVIGLNEGSLTIYERINDEIVEESTTVSVNPEYEIGMASYPFIVLYNNSSVKCLNTETSQLSDIQSVFMNDAVFDVHDGDAFLLSESKTKVIIVSSNGVRTIDLPEQYRARFVLGIDQGVVVLGERWDSRLFDGYKMSNTLLYNAVDGTKQDSSWIKVNLESFEPMHRIVRDSDDVLYTVSSQGTLASIKITYSID